MRSAGRVVALLTVIGMAATPASVLAQPVDGAPTPAGTVSDTRHAGSVVASNPSYGMVR